MKPKLLDFVYKDLIISTIVDLISVSYPCWLVYKDLIISTIVDSEDYIRQMKRVYKDLIISTIVDKIKKLNQDIGGL